MRRFQRLLLVALATPLAASAPPVWSQGTGAQRRIVVFDSRVSVGKRLSVAAAGGRIVRRLDLINAVVVEGEEGALSAAQESWTSAGSVVRVDPDPRVQWLQAEAAPSFSDFAAAAAPRFRRMADNNAAYQDLPWGVRRVRAPLAWARTRGRGVAVAVIDTGIDYDHPDLKENIAGGWNALDPGKPGDFMDDHGHGTHCAGIIAALDNGIGVVGVAPGASLYGVKVLNADGSATFDQVIAGMQWVVEHRIPVASLSLGAETPNESLKAAVAAVARAGVVLIAAAGNSGGPVLFPAAYPGAFAVAAMNSSEKVAAFSCRGREVAFLAPGVSINSTFLGGGTKYLSGTSMATPHVAGLAALAIAGKGLSGPEEIGAALKAAAVPLPDAEPEQQGAGVVDAERLLR